MAEHAARGASARTPPEGSAVTASALGLEPNAWYDPAYRDAYNRYVILAETESKVCVIRTGKRYRALMQALMKRPQEDVTIVAADDRRRDSVVAQLSPAMRLQVVAWGFQVETFDPEKHK